MGKSKVEIMLSAYIYLEVVDWQQTGIDYTTNLSNGCQNKAYWRKDVFNS